MMQSDFFDSRYIIKSDHSFDTIDLGNRKYFDFAELQKVQGRSWHSRPYEYAFVVRNMIKAYLFHLVKLDSVLDLACGVIHPGYMAIANIKEVGQVIALDLDSRLLTNGIEHSKVDKIIGDAASTGFNDNYFDIISCISALEHMSNWKNVIQEMSYLLKPSGMAFVTIDISVDPAKTAKHNVDDKVPDDYKKVFEQFGLYVFGNYNGELIENTVDTICSKYSLVNDESEFKKGQHRALKTFRLVLRK